jgi:hypothetical protein
VHAPDGHGLVNELRTRADADDLLR